MSEGSRSGVNWMRLKLPPTDLASALASIVLPTPGMSSMSMCPAESSVATESSTAGRFPTMTVSMFWIRRPASEVSC